MMKIIMISENAQVLIGENSRVLDGINAMMSHYVNMIGNLEISTDIPTALLIVEIAKRAEDREEWFPRGKWATIRSLKARIKVGLDIAIAMND